MRLLIRIIFALALVLPLAAPVPGLAADAPPKTAFCAPPDAANGLMIRDLSQSDGSLLLDQPCNFLVYDIRISGAAAGHLGGETRDADPLTARLWKSLNKRRVFQVHTPDSNAIFTGQITDLTGTCQ